MSYIKVGGIFAICFFMQTTLLNLIGLFGYTPNLLLALSISFSFVFEGEVYGVMYGAIFGLMYDICWSPAVGPVAMGMVVVSVFVLILREYVNRESMVSAVIAFSGSVLIYYCVLWCMYAVAGIRYSFVSILPTILYSGVYTVLVCVLCFIILLRIAKKSKKEELFR